MPIYRNKNTGVIVDTVAPVVGDTWESIAPKVVSHDEPKKTKPKPKKEK